jgi:hypothetical protein
LDSNLFDEQMLNVSDAQTAQMFENGSDVVN